MSPFDVTRPQCVKYQEILNLFDVLVLLSECSGWTSSITLAAADGEVLFVHVLVKTNIGRSDNPDGKVYGANMGPIWGQHDPGGPNDGPINFAIWEAFQF